MYFLILIFNSVSYCIVILMKTQYSGDIQGVNRFIWYSWSHSITMQALLFSEKVFILLRARLNALNIKGRPRRIYNNNNNNKVFINCNKVIGI